MRQPMRWVSVKTVEALIERAGYSPSTGSRLLRELAEERIIEKEEKSYRYNPDTDIRVTIKRMGEWFASLPENEQNNG